MFYRLDPAVQQTWILYTYLFYKKGNAYKGHPLPQQFESMAHLGGFLNYPQRTACLQRIVENNPSLQNFANKSDDAHADGSYPLYLYLELRTQI